MTVMEKPPAALGSRLLTSEQFLDWLRPGVHADLVRGEIKMHSPVNLRHANLVNFLDRLLGLYVEDMGIGVVHRETVAVRLSARETFLPDLAFFTTGQAARLVATHAPFAPALVVEVLSPATAERDTGQKFASYELHDVQEYWILDPETLEHRFYRREGDMLAEFGAGADRVDSRTVDGFWVKRSWLNPEKLPAVTRCLAEIRRRRGSRSGR